MHRFITLISRQFTCLLLITILAGIAVAQDPISLLDNFEGGTNQNKFADYWYFYNDSKDNGTSAVTNSRVDGTTLAFVGKYTPGYNGSNYAGRLDYLMGANKPVTSNGDAYGQSVGMGTNLVSEGNVINLTGAKKITFVGKAAKKMFVRVILVCGNVTDWGNFQTKVLLDTVWQPFTINLDTSATGIHQPSWAQKKTLDLTKAQKIHWEISMDEAGTLSSGSILIDDIYIDGYKFAMATCTACSTAAGQSPAGLSLANFEGTEPVANSLGYWSYAYSDAISRPAGGTASSLTAGVTPNPVTPSQPTLNIGANGYNSTNGAFVTFDLGSTYESGTNTVLPFAGIGTMLSNDVAVYNAQAAGATGIYFDYKTDGQVEYIRFEVQTNQVFTTPTNPGIVHYVLLKGTAGQWRGATVPFSALMLPDWPDVRALAADKKIIKLTALTKLQWVYQNEPLKTGSIAIDNVRLLNAQSAISYRATPGHARTLGSLQTVNGSILLHVPASTQATMVRVTDFSGATVAVSTIQTGTSGTMTIGNGRLAPGAYIVNVYDRDHLVFQTKTFMVR